MSYYYSYLTHFPKRYEGVRPVRKPNQVYVANHTTVLDFAVLAQVETGRTTLRKLSGTGHRTEVERVRSEAQSWLFVETQKIRCILHIVSFYKPWDRIKSMPWWVSNIQELWVLPYASIYLSNLRNILFLTHSFTHTHALFFLIFFASSVSFPTHSLISTTCSDS